MNRHNWLQHVSLLAVVLCLGAIAGHPFIQPGQTALASAPVANFGHVNIVSPMFLYKGNRGVLLMDKRNGNCWFIARGDKVDLAFRDPVFIARLPLEKLDQGPQ